MTLKADTKTLMVEYSRWKQVLAVSVGFPLLIFIIYSCLKVELPVIEILVVISSAFLGCRLFDIVTTVRVAFYPDKVEKVNILWKTIIPTSNIVIQKKTECAYISFSYGSQLNIRESLKVYPGFLKNDYKYVLVNYIKDVYGVAVDYIPKRRLISSEKRKNKDAANEEFEYVTSMFRQFYVFSIIYLAVYLGVQVYFDIESSVELKTDFNPNVLLARLSALALVVFCHYKLRQLVSVIHVDMPVFLLLKKAANNYIFSVIVICGVAILGLPLFIYSANKLDFYVLYLISVLFFYEFYPRLSIIQRVAQGNRLTVLQNQKQLAVPRRSLEVSLVLAGSLAIAGHGERHMRVDQNGCGGVGSTNYWCDNHYHSGSGNYFRVTDPDVRDSVDRSTTRRGGFGGFARSFFSGGG